MRVNNFTLTQKQTLESLVERDTKIFAIAYDPTTVVNDPEAEAAEAGWTEFYREDTRYLVEVIYTSP